MSELPRCGHCGVPIHVTAEHKWLGDGSIVQSAYQEHRMCFIETENFDPLYMGISELASVPIEPIVVDVAHRSTRAYMNQLVSEDVRHDVQNKALNIEAVFEMMFEIGRIMGYGDPGLIDARYEPGEHDFARMRYVSPCSKPLIAGTVAGTVESYTGRDAGVTYEDVGSDAIDVMVVPATCAVEKKDRMWFRPYRPKPGGIELRKCPECGGPAKLAEFEWDLDRGVIRSRETGRRMALVGPPMIEPIFRELESELGASVPEVVIEAQRRFVRGGRYSVSEVRSEDNMREQLQRRGLGYVRELDMSRKGVHLALENAATPLLSVGFTLGLFELSTGIESKVDWDLSSDGLLEVTVAPWN